MKNDALRILQTLRKHGFIALFAGGCVRDTMMGNIPGDYDIVTDASPQQVMQLFKRTVPVGVQFGIIIVIIKDRKFEVAQFRNWSKNKDFDEMLREDALHRDFTINGMLYDPFTDRIFDYVRGRQDIDHKLIRGIVSPYDRFLEDRLRMMRAVRFAVSFNYDIEDETFTALQHLAPEILTVSVERIRDELLKILLSPHPDQGIPLLDAGHLLEPILPEVFAMKGIQQPPEFHPEGDVLTHTLLMLQQMNKPSPELAMGVLLHDVGKPGTYSQTDRIRFHNHAQFGAEIAETICKRFKFSTRSTEKIITLVRDHQKFFDVEHMRTSTLKRFLRQEDFADLLELHRLDCISSQRSLHIHHFCQAKLEEFQKASIRPSRLISGKDLIKLGFTPGPVFKQVLDYIEDAQLEGIVSTKQGALELVKDIQETLPD